MEAAAESKTPRRNRKVMTGVVRSNKMQKTVVVEIESRVMHPVYGKYVRRRERFKAHDEKNECRPGDTVQIVSTRPLSREKCWRVARIVERAQQV